MKKSKKLKLALMLLPMAALTFTACSDNTDDPITPPGIDTKWDIDENMDTSVKPGDDFARYCWGKWYDEAGDPALVGNQGIIFEALAATNQKFAKLDNKELKQIYQDAVKLNIDQDGGEDACALIQKLCAQLDKKENYLEVAKLLGEFYASGRNCLLQCSLAPHGEKNYFFINLNSNYLSDFVPNLNGAGMENLLQWLSMAGLTEEQIKAIISALKSDGGSDDSESGDNYTSEEILQAFCASFGISANQLLNGDKLYDIIIEGKKQVLSSMILSVASDMVLVQKYCLNALGKAYGYEDGKTYVTQALLTNHLLDYPCSKEYSEQNRNDELREKILNLMEELRTIFAQRIDNLEWMSSTSKVAAKNKLAAMKFFALYPDHWYSIGIPQLEGKSLYNDVNIARKTRRDLQKEMLKVNPREDFLNVVFACHCPAFEPNCFHNTVTNTATILEPMVTAPYYTLGDSDAKLYAIGTCIGHELTHGFDTGGALYGPKGEEENWWTVADKQEFDTRTQLLVDCYNHLPAYQNCPSDSLAKGTETLSENIADLGGLELALQAYTNNLEKQGVQGEQLAKAQKRFFQAYANLWRTKCSDSYNNKNMTDVHPNNYTRLLGSTMNCNRWYELYDVKWGDKNYLRPESRTHIW